MSSDCLTAHLLSSFFRTDRRYMAYGAGVLFGRTPQWGARVVGQALGTWLGGRYTQGWALLDVLAFAPPGRVGKKAQTRAPVPDARVQEAKAPAADPDLQFEVVVIGGGVIGLSLALRLASSLRGRQRVRVYESSWTKADGVLRRDSVSANSGRGLQVVTLEHGAFSQLPVDAQERIFPPDSFMSQWPLLDGREHSRNVSLGDLEAALLEVVQEAPYRDVIELHRGVYDRSEHDRVASEDMFHALVLADGPDAVSARREVFGQLFGPGDPAENAESFSAPRSASPTTRRH
ncbi:unnamed protein product [Prorocentrum cordatum]|uniref:Protoporphyrinogen oxidase n=1 Tax=Prorocentrum cordatum TaxID=2364126 RepID=A0ABN9WCR6_9DINO|nr:unnamed protein product [Polarella glacialis]